MAGVEEALAAGDGGAHDFWRKLFAMFSSAVIQSGCSFMQGMRVNSLPLAARKSSQPRIPISSMVSRQSETNAGQMTSIFFLPSCARRTSS